MTAARNCVWDGWEAYFRAGAGEQGDARASRGDRWRTGASLGAWEGGGERAVAMSLEEVYVKYASFGSAQQTDAMDNVHFAKMAKEAGFLSRRCTPTDVDLIFTKAKVKGERKIGFEQFQQALVELGKLNGMSYDEAAAKLVDSGGPQSSGTTADSGGVLDKLMDPNQYPGGASAANKDAARQGKVRERQAMIKQLASMHISVEELESGDDLQKAFLAFSSFGTGRKVSDMDIKGWAKMCKDTEITGSRFNQNDADLCYAACKEREVRRINFAQFKYALQLAAERQGCAVEELETKVVQRPPAMNNVSRADGDQALSRLTDVRNFTGVYKTRFGKAAGLVKDANKMEAELERMRKVKSLGGQNHSVAELERGDGLQQAFLAFASFGTGGKKADMDNSHWAKMNRDAGLLDGKYTSTDADLVFAQCKEKELRRINFNQFLMALEKVAKKKGEQTSAIESLVLTNTPKLMGVSVSDTDSTLSRLTDPSNFTGQYKTKFGMSGGDPADAKKREKFDERNQMIRVLSGQTFSTADLENGDELQRAFLAFASFGAGKKVADMDNARFAKLCKDCGLVSSRFSMTDVDLCFSSVKERTLRRIGFAQFKHALAHIAAKSGTTPDDIEGRVKNNQPAMVGVSRSDTDSTLSRLTSVENFTGVYKTRFGKAAGLVKDAVKLKKATDHGNLIRNLAGKEWTVADLEGGTELQRMFLQYCSFGAGGKSLADMDNVRFAKMAKETGLVSPKCTPTDIDLIFTSSKVREARKISYSQFEYALEKIANKSGRPVEDIHAIVIANPPQQTGTTKVAEDATLARMTDPANFTGAYKLENRAR